MTSKEITDLIIGFEAVITLFISLRAFYLYSKTRSDTLFIVGLAMAVIALGGITGVIGDYLITSGAFNTFWFRYIGQIVSYASYRVCYTLHMIFPTVCTVRQAFTRCFSTYRRSPK